MAIEHEFDIYCDESRPELFVSESPTAPYAAIGSLWMPTSYRSVFKARVNELRQKHDTWGEFKWKKASHTREGFYRDVVQYFLNDPNLRFRCIIIDARELDLARFHNDDGELGFYKFYYQLITHWMLPNNRYRLYCDDKVNRDPTRLGTLGKVLRNTHALARVDTVQAVRSDQSAAIQLCDLLLGATQSCFNQTDVAVNPVKAQLVRDIELHLKHRIAPTARGAEKFNIFRIQLQRPIA